MAEMKPDQYENGLPYDMEALLRGLDSLSEDFDNPDRQFSKESKEALNALVSMLDESEREFAEKSVVINHDVFAKFRKAARLLKRVSASGGRVTQIDMEPHVSPAFIRFATDRALIMSGDSLEAFAELVETADCMEIEPSLDGTIEFDFSFLNMWKKIDEDLNDD